MHGQSETSNLPRTVWVLAHSLILLLVAWLLLGGGITEIGHLLGQDWPAGDPTRRGWLLTFGIVLWLRMALGAFVLLKRRFAWSECISVIGAVAFYQLGFALLGAASPTPTEPIDGLAIAVFALGSALNTAAEVARKRFKDDPANAGRLYTGGPFSLVRHPNYLGDVLWALGWAMMTRNPWAFLLPAIAAAGFVLFFIPQLSAYLAGRYGEQYEDWARRTTRLVPFVY